VILNKKYYINMYPIHDNYRVTDIQSSAPTHTTTL